MEEKKRLSGKEKQELECLIALYWMTGEQSHLRKRMEESGCWADYEQAQVHLKAVQDSLFETLPAKQLKDLVYYMSKSEVRVRLPSACPEKEYVHVEADDMVYFLDKVMAAECRYCLLEGKDIEKCRLRKKLDSFGIEGEDSVYLCKYANYKE